ncbi:hypothetical protein P6U16_24570 (plasmid) [Rhizobium sp. 32-5/1]|nr:hypothetical protein [Rhizobium sp. 32-5/1]WEZ85320.1 hypothetical protein P6U16_24570 [Rhizobium sp. 32-5/1]
MRLATAADDRQWADHDGTYHFLECRLHSMGSWNLPVSLRTIPAIP